MPHVHRWNFRYCRWSSINFQLRNRRFILKYPGTRPGYLELQRAAHPRFCETTPGKYGTQTQDLSHFPWRMELSKFLDIFVKARDYVRVNEQDDSEKGQIPPPKPANSACSADTGFIQYSPPKTFFLVCLETALVFCMLGYIFFSHPSDLLCARQLSPYCKSKSRSFSCPCVDLGTKAKSLEPAPYFESNDLEYDQEWNMPNAFGQPSPYRGHPTPMMPDYLT